jgi:hypothetical protein
MISRAKFLGITILFALVTKVIGEFVHEIMGHGFFILLFGGEIVRVHLSPLWPYELSYIKWKGNFEPWQQTWIAGGGILFCLIVTGILQFLLLLRFSKDWRLSIPLLWLSFWTFLNPTGYLIIGGVRPFGDIEALIADGVLVQSTSLLIGLLIFLAAFFSLSKVLTNQFIYTRMVKTIKELRIALITFWITIPMATAITCLGMRMSPMHLQIFTILSLTPLPGATLIPNLLKPCFSENK